MSEHLIGDAGADYVLTQLSNTRNPLQFIEDFQNANGLRPSANDMSRILIYCY